jgi:N6-L-threonylcarbamoyladenine synthase
MKILGIESSCDETAAAVVEDGRKLLSNVVQSQIDIHVAYGGVVPEVAARSHIEVINPVIDQALTDARLSWDDIDAIAVTYAPGLIGSLLVGSLAARTLAILKNKPLYPIHHVEAHVYANFLNERVPEFPMLALIVSGNHSQLVLFRDHGDYELLGQTQDDAIGEAFDKVAKIIGLPYPGGPSIAKAALHGDPSKYKFPKAKMQNPYDFSFSGLKTAVLRAVQHEVGKDFTFPSWQLPELLNDAQRNDFAASFQHVAIETLVDKTIKAYHEYSPASVVIAGGVAASL